MISLGIRTSIAKELYCFAIHYRGTRPPLPPTGDAHAITNVGNNKQRTKNNNIIIALERLNHLPHIVTLSSKPLTHSLTPLHTRSFGIHSRGSKEQVNVTSGSQVIDDVTEGAGGNDVSTANAEIKVKHVQYAWICKFNKSNAALAHLRIDLRTYGVSGIAKKAMTKSQHRKRTELLRCSIASFAIVQRNSYVSFRCCGSYCGVLLSSSRYRRKFASRFVNL